MVQGVASRFLPTLILMPLGEFRSFRVRIGELSKKGAEGFIVTWSTLRGWSCLDLFKSSTHSPPPVCGCYCLNFHEKSLHPRRLRTERFLSMAFIVACTQSVTWQQWAEWDPSFETASLYTAITVCIFSVHPENFKITTSITDYSCLPIKLQVFRFIR